MNSREIEVVVVEVLVTGPTGGVRGRKAGDKSLVGDLFSVRLPFLSGAMRCSSSNILRKDSSVRNG